jgi:uncharacterized protein (TIGR02217 family)
MVASTITIEPIYLDCSPGGRFALAGGVSTLEDDTVVHESDSRTVSTNERSERALQMWQITFKDIPSQSEDAQFLWDLYRVCRTSKGFLFISPKEEERVATGQPIRNTVTGLNTGNGSATTFQLQFALELDYDIGSGSAEIDTFDVNHPILGSTVVAYANGTPVTVSGFSATTGIVTLASPPANGAVMTADYERAIPVRFTSSTLSRTLLEADHSEARSVQIKEIL